MVILNNFDLKIIITNTITEHNKTKNEFKCVQPYLIDLNFLS